MVGLRGKREWNGTEGKNERKREDDEEAKGDKIGDNKCGRTDVRRLYKPCQQKNRASGPKT